MAKIKSYTDINQSNKLAEILPLESADMIYRPIMDIDSMSNSGFLDTPDCYPFNDFKNSIIKPLPCWSLAALLDIISEYTLQRVGRDVFVVYKNEEMIISTEIYDNPIDTCVEMIIKLYNLRKI